MVIPASNRGPLTPQLLDSLLARTIYKMREVALQLIAAHWNGGARVEIMSKPGYAGTTVDDVFTGVDIAAQAEFMRWHEWRLQGWGVCGEEDNLRIPCTAHRYTKVVVTVDPIDGTKYLKKLLNGEKDNEGRELPRCGVTIMLSVRIGDTVIAAYILDLFTGELWRVPPGDNQVLLTESTALTLPRAAPIFPRADSLQDGRLMLHRSAESHLDLVGLLERAGDKVFGSLHDFEGSIGSDIINLVSGHAVAVARRPGSSTTPWDDAPLVAMCRAVGILTFRVTPDGLEEFALAAPLDKPERQEYGILYVHKSYAEELAGVLPVRRM